jgi:hypothetical protein
MKREAQFAICVSSKGYAASLEVRKIYLLVPDRVGAKYGLVRVIDEVIEDYLFPGKFFVPSRPACAQHRK